MSFCVVFTPESQEQLVALYHYVAKATSPRIADDYTAAIVDYCESLTTFPRRGTLRDDVRPGLRVTNYRKRTLIAYTVESDQVSIIGIFYGGQDFEASLLAEDGSI